MNLESTGNYTYEISPFYTDVDFGTFRVKPNSRSYAFTLQFYPNVWLSNDTAWVKDVNFYLSVADGMPSYTVS